MPHLRKNIVGQLLLLLCAMLPVFGKVLSQKGMPYLQSFTPAQYQNQGKIWDIDSAPNGIVYMAADKGLLEYDGKSWRGFKGSKGLTRSLWVVNDSLIYTGSDLDFGVWTRNEYHQFEYRSLYPFQEVVQDENEEFWQVHALQGDPIFVSSQNLYVYTREQLVRIAAPQRFSKSFLVNGTLYLADEKRGLFRFDGFALKLVFEYPADNPFKIQGICADGSGLLIVTRDSGLFRYTNGTCTPVRHALSDALKIAKVFSFEPISPNQMAFGTLLKGIYIADTDGRIIHQVNKYKGLPSNTILSLYSSPSASLWVGMDFGVSVMDLDNDFSIFYDYRGDLGTATAAALHGETLYVGTNQGLYYSPWPALANSQAFFAFPIVPNTEGQVWTLEAVGETLLMGHDKGLFAVRENTVENLSQREGVWTIRPYKNYLLTGNYNGISIFEQRANKWSFLKKMDSIAGSCNQLLIEGDNVLWINIPTYGIIRAVLDEELSPVDRQIFLADSFEGSDLYLQRDGPNILVTSDKFRYTFDPATRSFAQKGAAPFLAIPEEMGPLVRAATALDTTYRFYPIYNGFVLQNTRAKAPAPDRKYTLAFRRMEAFNTDEKMPFYPGIDIPYRLRNLRIEFVVPNQSGVQYQYKRQLSDAWSEWQSEHYVELINLGEGDCKLFVRAKLGEYLTDPIALTVHIQAPWYRSLLAYGVYFLLLVSLLYTLSQGKKRSLEKQRKKLQLEEQKALRQQSEDHKQQIRQLEQEQLQAEYEQMKQQLRNKTIELANKSKENEEKNRLLHTLKEKCDTAQANPASSKMQWKEMERLLDAYLNEEDKTFEIQMDELHQEFLKKLKARFPTLSRNDLRLCVYLKIGISSKEIADILNIQPSSFYISRSRIRKKLDLGTDEKLYDFLNGI